MNVTASENAIGKGEEHLLQFVQQFPQSFLSKGQKVSVSGSLDEHFFFLESGCVKMMTTSSEGKNLTLHLFFPGSCFPLLSLVDSSVNYDFEVLVDSQVRKIPKARLVSLLQIDGPAAYAFLLRVLRGLNGLLKRIEQNAFIPAYNQVAGLLLYFTKHFGQLEEGSETVMTKITHQDIAEWLGLSRENVSLQMKRLEREGLIKKKGHMVVLVDKQGLEDLAAVYHFSV